MRFPVRYVMILVILGWILVNLCSPVATSAANVQKIALVIGNGDYKSAPLKNPVNDARDIAATLKELGFEVLYQENASERDMKNAIHRFGQKLKKGGIGLFYFAGHGMQVDGRNYLIPVNSDIKSELDIEYESVNAGRLLAEMEDAGNDMNIVILDSCRDNPFARSFRSSSRGLARMDAPKGSFIAYATAPGQTAADGDGRNGIFTGCLLRHMKTPDLKIEDVLKRVRVDVSIKTDGIQIPWQSSSLMGDFYFVKKSGYINLPKNTNTSLDEFLEESKARQLEMEKWNQWQEAREQDYKKVLKIDEDPYLNKERKKEAWKIFLASISQNNPYTDKDDEIRNHSKLRYQYWETFKTEPEYASIDPQIINPKTDQKITNDLGMTFVYIEPGSFMMGSPSHESGRYNDEKQHRVTLTKGFYMQTTEVTQRQWKSVMGSNPSKFSGCNNCPVESVSWNDVQAFICKLNRREGKSYRLPTEAEWEYACRAGSGDRFCFGDDNGRLGEYAWYSGNSGSKTHPVGQKRSNSWGLYDMHGNVWEWCQDWYGNYPSYAVTDPTGPSSGSDRVGRGGGWINIPRGCRSADRVRILPGDRGIILGFRLALSPVR